MSLSVRQTGQDHEDPALAIPEKKTLSGRALAKVLKPYFWPDGVVNKVRCLLTWVFLAMSKTCGLLVPIFMGKAIQELTQNGPTLFGATQGSSHKVYWYIFVFCALQLGTRVFKVGVFCSLVDITITIIFTFNIPFHWVNLLLQYSISLVYIVSIYGLIYLCMRLQIL